MVQEERIIEKNDINSREYNELINLVDNLTPRAHDFFTKGNNSAGDDVKRELKIIRDKAHQVWKSIPTLQRQRINERKDGNN